MGKVRLWDTKNCIGMYICIDATEKTLYTQQSCTTHAHAQTQESCTTHAHAQTQESCTTHAHAQTQESCTTHAHAQTQESCTTHAHAQTQESCTTHAHAQTQESCTTHAHAQTQESCIIYYAQASRQYPQEVGPGEAVVKLSRHLVEVDRDVAAPACTHPVKVHRQSQFVTLVDVEWSTVPDLQATASEEEGVHWELQHHLCLMGCLQPSLLSCSCSLLIYQACSFAIQAFIQRCSLLSC